jgi:hypothetical protein
MIKELSTTGYNLCEFDMLEIKAINQLIRTHNKAELTTAKASKQITLCSNHECPANWVQHGCTSSKYHDCSVRQ